MDQKFKIKQNIQKQESGIFDSSGEENIQDQQNQWLLTQDKKFRKSILLKGKDSSKVQDLFQNSIINSSEFMPDQIQLNNQKQANQIEKQKKRIKDLEMQVREYFENNKVLKQCLKEKDDLVEELRQRLELRDNQIKDMVDGYCKDVIGMREINYRVNQGEGIEQQIEVKYFDEKSVMDDTMRKLMNSTLRDQEQQFQKILSQRNFQIKNQLEEIRVQKNIIKSLKFKEDDPYLQFQYLMKNIKGDVATLWKLIQENIGAKSVFRVFEQRKNGYGIDFKQIDELISNSLGPERDYKEFKKKFSENLDEYKEKVLIELKEIRIQKENEISLVKQQNVELENLVSKFTQETELKLKNEYQKKILNQTEMFQQKQKKSFVNLEARFFLYKWYFIVKLFQRNQNKSKENPNINKEYIIKESEKKQNLEKQQQEKEQIISNTVNNEQNQEIKSNKYSSLQQKSISYQEENNLQEFQQVLKKCMKFDIYLGSIDDQFQDGFQFINQEDRENLIYIKDLEMQCQFWKERFKRVNNNYEMLQQIQNCQANELRRLQLLDQLLKNAFKKMLDTLGYSQTRVFLKDLYCVEKGLGYYAQTFLQDLVELSQIKKVSASSILIQNEILVSMDQQTFLPQFQEKSVNTRLMGIETDLGEINHLQREYFDLEECGKNLEGKQFENKEVQTEQQREIKQIQKKKNIEVRNQDQIQSVLPQVSLEKVNKEQNKKFVALRQINKYKPEDNSEKSLNYKKLIEWGEQKQKNILNLKEMEQTKEQDKWKQITEFENKNGNLEDEQAKTIEFLSKLNLLKRNPQQRQKNRSKSPFLENLKMKSQLIKVEMVKNKRENSQINQSNSAQFQNCVLKKIKANRFLNEFSSTPKNLVLTENEINKYDRRSLTPHQRYLNEKSNYFQEIQKNSQSNKLKIFSKQEEVNPFDYFCSKYIPQSPEEAQLRAESPNQPLNIQRRTSQISFQQ